MKRTVIHLVAMIVLSLPFALDAAPRPLQDPPPEAQQDAAQASFFSGIVTEFNQSSVTVNRKGIGQDSATHTFAIDGSTRVEGKLRLRAKVTVRFVSNDQGMVAVHIIVR